MRTTVTIDPDVEVLLRKNMRESGAPFKQVLNNALRKALGGARATPIKPFKQRSFKMGVPLQDLTKANELAASLEDDEQIAKLRAGR